MKFIHDYSELIENEIAGISFPNEPKNLYDPLSYFLSLGGKRMRPLLTILSGELFGEKKENLMPAAIAIELFHNFSPNNSPESIVNNGRIRFPPRAKK